FDFVCKIDRELYRVVSDDIQTDDVIITAQQIAHIEEGHPGAYVQFMQYLPRVLRDPDFILRGNKPHTALVIKQIVEEDAITEVVLRLKVSSDPAAYRNSDRKSTRLNSSHVSISYAVFCLKKKRQRQHTAPSPPTKS